MLDDVHMAIANADKGISKLPAGGLPIDGESSNKVRCLLNNLCAISGTVYCEVGLLCGSTFISALYANEDTPAIGIDNWSRVPQAREDFHNAMRIWRIDQRPHVAIHDCDLFAADVRGMAKPINVLFYDGCHDWQSTFAAVGKLWPILSHRFAIVVDDFNYPQVADAVSFARGWLRIDVRAEWMLPAHHNGDLEQWWNGLYVGVWEKI